MADIDRDFPARDTARERVDRTYEPSVRTGGSAGWWIAGLLVLAVLIIGFFAMSGGNPAPVEPAASTVESPAAPADGVTPITPAETPAEPAPMAAPAEPAPAVPVEPAAPAEPAPAAPGV